MAIFDGDRSCRIDFEKRTTTSRFSTVLSNWKLSLVLISTICIFMSQKRINVLPQEMLHVKILLKCNYIVLFIFKLLLQGKCCFISTIGVPPPPYALFIATSAMLVSWKMHIIVMIQAFKQVLFKIEFPCSVLWTRFFFIFFYHFPHCPLYCLSFDL